MQPLLDQHGVTVVAVSKDPPATVLQHVAEDEIPFTMLSDPDLALIKRFGLLHQGGLEFRTFFLGPVKFPMGWPVGFKEMAIPTTLLIDEDGVVRWIDQADDYRIRGDRERTAGALREVWGEG
jgi:peroxiredoxin